MKIVTEQLRIDNEDTLILRMFAKYKSGKPDGNVYLIS